MPNAALLAPRQAPWRYKFWGHCFRSVCVPVSLIFSFLLIQEGSISPAPTERKWPPSEKSVECWMPWMKPQSLRRLLLHFCARHGLTVSTAEAGLCCFLLSSLSWIHPRGRDISQPPSGGTQPCDQCSLVNKEHMSAGAEVAECWGRGGGSLPLQWQLRGTWRTAFLESHPDPQWRWRSPRWLCETSWGCGTPFITA